MRRATRSRRDSSKLVRRCPDTDGMNDNGRELLLPPVAVVECLGGQRLVDGENDAAVHISTLEAGEDVVDCLERL